MNEPKDQQEPSMEEILSSIRRIIADEEGEERETDEPDGSGERARAGEQDEDLDEGEDEDDVLELTEVVREGDEVVDLQAEREAHAEDAPVEAEPPVDEPVEEQHDEAADTADQVELLPSEQDGLPEEEEAAPETPPETPEQPAPAREGLVSAAAAGVTAGAFAKLNQAMHHNAEGEPPVPESDRSIEAFLADLLRPMLREWLEENLPPMVERLVAQEIEKLAKRAELL